MTAPSVTKSQMVYDQLRRGIMDGSLLPGQTLVIDSLAKEFGVSIIPVREALRQLQAERLVCITPHTGVQVVDVRVEDLQEIFALLTALETAAIDTAIAKATEADFTRMDDCLARLSAAASTSDSEGFTAANREFHLLPCQIAGFDRVREELTRVFAEWERLHRQAFRNAASPDPQQANREHRAMVQAYRKGDGEKLRELLVRHNQKALHHYEKVYGAKKRSA